MTQTLPNRRLAGDRRGSVAVEFALLSPLFVALIVGLFQAGIYLQNYNALRSVSADASRYITVEYQKFNDLDESQIRTAVMAIAQNPPYLLKGEKLDVTVSLEETSRVSGAREYTMDLEYYPENWLPFIDSRALRLEFEKAIFVAEPPA